MIQVMKQGIVAKCWIKRHLNEGQNESCRPRARRTGFFREWLRRIVFIAYSFGWAAWRRSLPYAGCGRKADFRSEAGAVAVQERPAEQQPATGQAASESDEGDLLVPDNIAIPDLDNEEKRQGKGHSRVGDHFGLGGTVRSYAAELPFPVVKEQGEWVVLLGQEDSKLWVSAKFCNADGQVDW